VRFKLTDFCLLDFFWSYRGCGLPISLDLMMVKRGKDAESLYIWSSLLFDECRMQMLVIAKDVCWITRC